jgi:hypothetical protein
VITPSEQIRRDNRAAAVSTGLRVLLFLVVLAAVLLAGVLAVLILHLDLAAFLAGIVFLAAGGTIVLFAALFFNGN